MNTYRWMSLQFFSFYVTWGIFLPYWTGWMVDVKGIEVSEASLIMSLGLMARGLSTLLVFPYASERFSSIKLLKWVGIGTLLAVLSYLPANSFSSLLIVTLAFQIFYPILMPALDYSAGVLVQNRQLNHYGRSRQWGSIGFIFAGILLTVFTGKFGDGVILWAFLLGASLFVSLAFMSAPAVLTEKPKADRSQKGGLKELWKIKSFPLVLTIVILIQAAHATYYNYGYLFLQEIDAPKYLIGVIINIAVFAEIIFFAIADRKFGNFSVGALLAVSALGSSIRWVLVFAFPNPIVFSVAQVLHACSFAMSHYAFMKYLINTISPAYSAKAQGLYSALAMSWSTAVFTIFGGFLYEIEPRYAFLGMVVCTVPATVLALYYRKMEGRKKADQVI